MAKITDVRPKITLACTECKERNYITKKNRRNDPDRLELKKFCPRCRTHTPHRETADLDLMGPRPTDEPSAAAGGSPLSGLFARATPFRSSDWPTAAVCPRRRTTSSG